MNQRLFRDTALLFFIIGALDFIANKLYLYWTTWWMDIILHFISGGVVAMTVMLVLNGLLGNNFSDKRKFFLLTLFASSTIGLLWEFFELYFQSTYLSDGLRYWTDTSSDLILDVLGGFFATKYSFYILNKYGK